MPEKRHLIIQIKHVRVFLEEFVVVEDVLVACIEAGALQAVVMRSFFAIRRHIGRQPSIGNASHEGVANLSIATGHEEEGCCDCGEENDGHSGDDGRQDGSRCLLFSGYSDGYRWNNGVRRGRRL